MIDIHIGYTVLKTPNTLTLIINRWNDYGFVTQFRAYYFDESLNTIKIGDVKIGYAGQTENDPTYKTLLGYMNKLPNNYFSVGSDIFYYREIAVLPPELKTEILSSLNDIAYKTDLIDLYIDEPVFKISILRNQSISIIKGKYNRVLSGLPELTDFSFFFSRPEEQSMPTEIEFNVLANSTPSTNVHAIIGRNGVGKTTILNQMITGITTNNSQYKFFTYINAERQQIDKYFFGTLVSVSFSAFDSFSPPLEQPNPSQGTCYYYIGLKSKAEKDGLRNIFELQKDCAYALYECFSNNEKRKRWKSAITKLGSDENFARMNLFYLEDKFDEIEDKIAFSDNSKGRYFSKISHYLNSMSSGHAVVLLTITRLVATVDEKTLVLIDEPESHLHPPLLSAFIRALSDLLFDRNGLAIIATHSPVVLQEIPRSCVWKINRVGAAINISRPDIETFGENVGTLTNEIFGLEVTKSGFFDLLVKSVNNGKSYIEIIAEYNNQLGLEGRAILKALTIDRDNKKS